MFGQRTDKDIGSNDPTCIAEPDHHRRTDGSFVMSRSVIAHPGQCSRLANVTASYNQVHREVLDTHSHMGLIEEYSVSYRSDADSQDRERITVAKPVGDKRGDHTED